jgi:hypothetical protein
MLELAEVEPASHWRWQRDVNGPRVCISALCVFGTFRRGRRAIRFALVQRSSPSGLALCRLSYSPTRADDVSESSSNRVGGPLRRNTLGRRSVGKSSSRFAYLPCNTHDVSNTLILKRPQASLLTESKIAGSRTTNKRPSSPNLTSLNL